jgi:hypothetical protein
VLTHASWIGVCGSSCVRGNGCWKYAATAASRAATISAPIFMAVLFNARPVRSMPPIFRNTTSPIA